MSSEHTPTFSRAHRAQKAIGWTFDRSKRHVAIGRTITTPACAI
jgi:hypothetical protein